MTPNGFPVGARVLVDSPVHQVHQDNAIVRAYFPEGSSSYLFPQYKVDFVGGDKNVAVHVNRVSVGKLF